MSGGRERAAEQGGPGGAGRRDDASAAVGPAAHNVAFWVGLLLKEGLLPHSRTFPAIILEKGAQA